MLIPSKVPSQGKDSLDVLESLSIDSFLSLVRRHAKVIAVMLMLLDETEWH